MRNILDDKLDEVNIQLIKMASSTKEIIDRAIDAFLGDNQREEKIVNLHRRIHRNERLIEQLAMNMLLLQAPVAKDLRAVNSILRVIYEMERMSNQSLDMTQLSGYLNTRVEDEELVGMAEATREMCFNAIDSFTKKDVELARKTAAMDDEIDDYFHRIRDILVAQIDNDTSLANEKLDIYMVTKYLERIADHAEQICYWIIYEVTGEKVE